MRTTLCELALKYRSDKVPDLHHSYTPYYHELLKDATIKRVLEIGIGSPRTMGHVSNYRTGASLFMWGEYFPDAEIWGLDIDRDALINVGNIQSCLCDQSNESELIQTAITLGGQFDLIIDDGSHALAHQALTAQVFIPRLLAPEGVYIIEDVGKGWETLPAMLLPYKCTIKEFNSKLDDDRLAILRGDK